MLLWAQTSFVIKISTAEQGVIINKIYPSTGSGVIHSKNTFQRYLNGVWGDIGMNIRHERYDGYASIRFFSANPQFGTIYDFDFFIKNAKSFGINVHKRTRKVK